MLREPKDKVVTSGWLSAELRATLAPDPESPLSRTRQLYLGLFRAIENGQLPFDTRLPSSREMASLLGLGRNTVIRVYEQLTAEGLLQTAGRHGTRVARQISPVSRHSASEQGWQCSHRATRHRIAPMTGRRLAPGEPDPSLFPRRTWLRAQTRAVDRVADRLGYQSAPLRETQLAIARFLASYRSLVVEPERIIVTAGTRQSLSVAAHLYADPGDLAWVECPGYTGAADAFRQAGLILQPCPVDGRGLQLRTIGDQVPRLIYTTPCFQYPTGVPLAADRRAALLDLSREHGSIVFEDDYDSEFRDDSQPRPALASESAGARVLHAGTFSKLLFPAMRVGWLVVPEDAIAQASHCLRVLGGGSHSLAQAVVTELLDDGAIARHLRRARQVYGQRRQVLIEQLRQHDCFESIDGVAGSLNLVLHFRHAYPLAALVSALNAGQLGAQPLEHLDWYTDLPDYSRALVVGLGNVETLAIPDTTDDLVEALSSIRE